MPFRMLTAKVLRIEEHDCRRLSACKRAFVAHIGPEPAGPDLAPGQDRHRGVVGVDALGREDCRSYLSCLCSLTPARHWGGYRVVVNERALLVWLPSSEA
jgi:hypothetical protein